MASNKLLLITILTTLTLPFLTIATAFGPPGSDIDQFLYGQVGIPTSNHTNGGCWSSLKTVEQNHDYLIIASVRTDGDPGTVGVTVGILLGGTLGIRVNADGNVVVTSSHGFASWELVQHVNFSQGFKMALRINTGTETAIGLFFNANNGAKISYPTTGSIGKVGDFLGAGGSSQCNSSHTVGMLYDPTTEFISIQFTVNECSSRTDNCPSVGMPLEDVSIKVGTTTKTTNETGQVNFTYPYNPGAITITASKNGYYTEYYNYTTTINDSLQLYLSKLVPNPLKRTIIVITPSTNNVTTPAQATFTINSSTIDTVYWSVAKRESSGAVILRSSVYSFTESTNVAYPVGRASVGNTGSTNDLGAYVLIVSNNLGDVIGIANFTINPPGGPWHSQIEINNALNNSLKDQLTAKITEKILADKKASELDDSKSFVAQAVEFAYGSPLIIPNMYLIAFLALALALITNTARRSD